MGLDRKSAKIQQDAVNLGVKHMIAIIDYDCDYLLKPTVNIAL